MIPFAYFIIFLIGYIIFIKINNNKLRIEYLITSILYIILSTHPNIISILLEIISCRFIANEYYIKTNVSYKCYTEDFNIFSLIIVFPFILIWVVLIPGILIIKLVLNKN